ncbi:hypothetical protein CIB84_015159 [Bambusicola thoracicus]|uniref:Uncharacterized protein n=1 Tax=Bambusicola thoracicus TaxID=9083 RepID=A0A2P4SAE9_BAMTH|nr:hypothetical protein CIB84_015159 [Bambusicola thoracicus]
MLPAATGAPMTGTAPGTRSAASLAVGWPVPPRTQQSLARAPWCCGALWAPAWSSVTAMLTVPEPRSAAPPAAATSANCPPRCARGSVLLHLPGLVSALSYAWRTRTVHPARSAACRTAAVRVLPHCRVRPTPHPARKGRHGVGHSSCSDHHIHLLQAQPNPGWGGCTGSCQFGAIPPLCHRSTHCPTAPIPLAAPPAEGVSTV